MQEASLIKEEEEDKNEDGHSIETLEREPYVAELEREHNTYGLSFVKGYFSLGFTDYSG